MQPPFPQSIFLPRSSPPKLLLLHRRRSSLPQLAFLGLLLVDTLGKDLSVLVLRQHHVSDIIQMEL